jgi:mono/diheme cytochrome c family protein
VLPENLIDAIARHSFGRAGLRRALAAAACAALPAWCLSAAPSDLVARGEYLSHAGGCVECHTQPGGQPYAGGLMMKTPFGSISTPNITPDLTTGIGAWTDEQFYRALHDGIGHRGEYLYPVMPFPWYARVSRDDVLAIKAYLFAQPAVQQTRPPNQLSFPYSVRSSLLAWREVFFKPPPASHDDPARPADVNRGDYLVNGLGHCGECHNSRPVAGASKWREALQGGVIDDWYAPNITSDVRDGIGAWSNADIARYLKTGTAPGKGVALGPMADTVHSLSHLNDADLLAIAAYLKTTPPKRDDDRKLALYAGHDVRGAGTYLDYCASCHGLQGQGLPGVIPPLNGDPQVQAKGPQDVIRVVLGGLEARQGYAPMLAVGAGMTDAEIADVSNYVRQQWANAAPPTAAPGMVAALRKETGTAMNAAAGCSKIGSAALAAALGDGASSAAAAQLRSVTDANMQERADRLVVYAHTASPRSGKADVVNGLTAAYCGVVRADAALDANQKALRLGHFSQLAYMAATHRALR